MFDPLEKEKATLVQATINADVAKKYTHRQLDKATNKSKSFLSSPTGIAGMFAAGSLKGVSSDTPQAPVSTLISMLLKFYN